jgi:ABC-2 type transport system permease protein
MTLLTPILFAGIGFAMFFIHKIDNTINKVAVVDESGLYAEKLENKGTLEFYVEKDTAVAKQALRDENYSYLLHITPAENDQPNPAVLYYISNEPGLLIKESILSGIQDIFQNKLMLDKFNISKEELDKVKDIKATVKIQNLETLEESNTGVKTGIGYVSAFLIYMFVFMFGSQVMAGVIEEKSSRIVEVIVSSVKPFQLMAGKIIGVAFVGLTQFVLWVILTFALFSIGGAVLGQSMMGEMSPTSEMAEMLGTNSGDAQQVAQNMMASSEVSNIMSSIAGLNWGFIIGIFLIYWIGGYLVYASLFAAVGSAVENEADTNQFMLPLTIPLLLALLVMASVMQNPNGTIAFWFSMIPFTSPVVMMMRLPFGVPTWELCLSIVLLVATFIATTWIAAKVYRVGILMYGKKTTWKELGKWLFYKN